MAEQKTHKVTLIPGDGIGPEVTQAVVRILEATGVKFDWERFAAGAEAFEIAEARNVLAVGAGGFENGLAWR